MVLRRGSLNHYFSKVVNGLALNEGSYVINNDLNRISSSLSKPIMNELSFLSNTPHSFLWVILSVGIGILNRKWPLLTPLHIAIK